MAPISFARGAPSPACLDTELLSDCARVALERDGTTILSYGTGGGYGPLREVLARRHDVDPARIFLTTAASRASSSTPRSSSPGGRAGCSSRARPTIAR